MFPSSKAQFALVDFTLSCFFRASDRFQSFGDRVRRASKSMKDSLKKPAACDNSDESFSVAEDATESASADGTTLSPISAMSSSPSSPDNEVVFSVDS